MFIKLDEFSCSHSGGPFFGCYLIYLYVFNLTCRPWSIFHLNIRSIIAIPRFFPFNCGSYLPHQVVVSRLFRPLGTFHESNCMPSDHSIIQFNCGICPVLFGRFPIMSLPCVGLAVVFSSLLKPVPCLKHQVRICLKPLRTGAHEICAPAFAVILIRCGFY